MLQQFKTCHKIQISFVQKADLIGTVEFYWTSDVNKLHVQSGDEPQIVPLAMTT
jgi:hypothetical protein